MKVQRTVRHIPRWTCCEISSWNVNTCSSSGFIENLQTIYCATFRDWGVSDEAFAGASSVWTNDWVLFKRCKYLPEWRNEGMNEGKEGRNEGMNLFLFYMLKQNFSKISTGLWHVLLRYTSQDGTSSFSGDGFRATDGDFNTAFFVGNGCAETQAGCRWKLKSYILNLWWVLSSLK